MNKNRIISLILIISLLFVTLTANLQVSAVTYPMYGEIKHSQGKGQTTIYSLPGTKGHETPENKWQSESKGPLVDGTVIKVLGEELDGDGDKWYKINYGDNFGNEGYAFSSHVVLKYDYQHDEAFELELQKFPESYRESLRHLHAKYPNWKFVAKEIDMDFNTAIDLQYSPNDVTKRKKMV
ncbi:MAG: SH3 domain-containing protein, partial [Acutalibacteraceae bacterium]|nr:SH3 domain-containing protein [Acutalibacteraceae bacterium]